MEERLKEDEAGRIERAEILKRWNVRNKLLVELNAKGFKQIHELDEFTAVDLNWLERVLNTFGDVETYRGTLMNVYTQRIF